MDSALGNMRIGECRHVNGKIVWIDACKSYAGTRRPEIPKDGEGIIRNAALRRYGIEKTTVTNAAFRSFIEDTGYITEAERIGWSYMFRGLMTNGDTVALKNLPWWSGVEGANWQQPTGPGSSISEFEDHPVVHISYNDARNYASWIGGRLPTEIEWEHAARGGTKEIRYPWGDEEPTDDRADFCNIWQGQFPHHNSCRDGYYGTAPARSFTPNSYGLFNMAGNVWEWCQDPFRVRSLSREAKQRNLEAKQFDERVLKGGSFLCHRSACWRYRIAARSGRPTDNATSNCGFRVVYDG
ncbi:MAG: formylglycine-generating enzyme family protein [Pseudomonadota bacterium]